jgi:ElaA protein
VGTLRWRGHDGGVAKIERVAVVREARGRGVGALLMRHCMDRLDRERVATVLSAQVHAQAFYRRLGYAAEGEPYLEDGLLHIRMRREGPL